MGLPLRRIADHSPLGKSIAFRDLQPSTMDELRELVGRLVSSRPISESRWTSRLMLFFVRAREFEISPQLYCYILAQLVRK